MEARGTVQIPAGANLFLSVSQELCDDLRKIHPVPDRLLTNGITFSEKNLEKTDFKELLSLGLHCVVIHSCNAIRVEQIRDIGQMKTIEHLNFSSTPLDVVDFSWISQLLGLRTLTLSGLGADDSTLGFITQLEHLEDLHLTSANISDVGVQALWKMATPRGIELGQCPIGDTTLEDIGRCCSLRSLMVPDTRISDNGVEMVVSEILRAGRDLTTLSLRSCRITDKSLVRLASLKDLRILDLFGTEVTEEGAAFLKKLLLRCMMFVGRNKGGGPKFWRVDST
jgi:Leucine-rich repeat (LRR) protein